MHLIHLLFALAAASVRQPFGHAQTIVPEKVVDLGYATYRTDISLDEGVTSFLGVRYAAPPVGDLRFRAPHPPARTTEIQNATVQPDECLQGSFGASSASPFRKRDASMQSEDCLFLNVHVPTNLSTDVKLPVIVWIHGGGYEIGSNGGTNPNPLQTLVHTSNGSLITVQIQYRLGLFGFLAGRAVARDGALNAGLLDQEFALRWIQTHISKFGGDPAKVTIYGQSAGAGSATQHIIAHGGNTAPPLFRAAMLSSPYLPSQYEFDDSIPEELFSMVSNLTNCTDRTLACLRSLDATILNDAGTAIELNSLTGTFVFVPIIDGSFVAERPTAALAEKHMNTNVILVVTNSHEGDIFVNATQLTFANTSITEYIAQLFPRMNESSIRQAADLYSGIGLPDVPSQAAEVMSDSIFICPGFYVLDAFGPTAWKGQFAVPPALHGSDLTYIFSDASTGFPAVNNLDFIRAFQQAFLDAAVHLDVNDHLSPVITPEWPAFRDAQQVMLFNVTTAGQSSVTVVAPDQSLAERCAFWRSLSDVNSQ